MFSDTVVTVNLLAPVGERFLVTLQSLFPCTRWSQKNLPAVPFA